jgi:agmatinase
MSKAAKTKAFNPNDPGHANAQVFGLPFTCEEADIVLVPVPWEVTTSYGGGTSRGPKAVWQASFQVDLYHPDFPGLWQRGIALDKEPKALRQQSDALKADAQHVLKALTLTPTAAQKTRVAKNLKHINQECAVMNEWVEMRTAHWLRQGKLVGLIGGDHSTPLGFFRSLAEHHGNFGILHIDAHMDLRVAYEGFTYSHASIMNHALALPQVQKIVQVGIRDHCQQEQDAVQGAKGRVSVHRSADLRAAQFGGSNWKDQCNRILKDLPDRVHISFDIDGLDPTLCPNTGTPVPGGLAFEEATYLLTRLARSGKQVIGFDLVEVSPARDNEWDANVGARLLWHLCGVLASGRTKQPSRKHTP